MVASVARRRKAASRVLLVAGVTGVVTLLSVSAAGAAMRATARPRPVGTIIPFSASGCNQYVCIHVEGSGTYVTNWWTTATIPFSTCTVAQFWANGFLVHKGALRCGNAGTSFRSDWPDPGYFAPGTQVCQTWTNVPGRPCEWIE